MKYFTVYGFKSDQIEAICNMILATRIPQSPLTKLEKVLCDADLDYLGRKDFYGIGGKLLEELKEQGVVETEREWNLVQKTFLSLIATILIIAKRTGKRKSEHTFRKSWLSFRVTIQDTG
ncbi:MAG: hypothetical protein U5K54_01410 [Cytophagales bacterium]|nr:hypothetical protein [Cytophagales bacterium]